MSVLKPEQFRNASSPMVSTFLPMVRELIPQQELNALSPMLVTVSEMMARVGWV